MCEFTFEENSLGNIFAELQNDRKVSKLMITTALQAFLSSAAANLAEPFPGFLLKRQEVRHKTGNLENINIARTKGQNVSSAVKVSTENKDVAAGALYLCAIYKTLGQIKHLKTREDLKALLGKNVEKALQI